MENLQKGDIVCHIYRPGFFRVESDPEMEEIPNRRGILEKVYMVRIRRVASKGMRKRFESRCWPIRTDVLVHVRRGLDELEQTLNILNPLS